MGYGDKEFAYARPVADAMAIDADFCAWILARTRFDYLASDSRLLRNEMQAARASTARTWWRSHFTEACRCEGCSGQETDLLAIFENVPRGRFAVHFEVKHPADRFPPDKDQAANYALRATCWSRNPPKAVLPHMIATTALLCRSRRLGAFAPHLPKFGSVITFEEIGVAFPQIGLPAED